MLMNLNDLQDNQKISDQITNYLITGSPGVGKTTIVRRVAAEFASFAHGFYTEEIRRGGQRYGFAITTLDGQKGVLAASDSKSLQRVGRYGVLVDEFDRIAVASLTSGLTSAKLFIIDEIGKMELFSSRFAAVVMQIINLPTPLLATVMLQSHPFVDRIKQRQDVAVLSVSLQNRNRLPRIITEILKKRFEQSLII